MKENRSQKNPLKEMSVGLKKKNSIISYLNSEINIALLGKEIYNEKESKNIFDINSVSRKERSLKAVQTQYLEELLKASTPNFKTDNETFNFNKAERIGWVILEFDIDQKLSATKNIKYINDYIVATIEIEPTLIYIQEKIVYVGFFFPNYATTENQDRLDKYRYFKDVRTALTHTLEANWSVDTNYNEIKAYKTICDSKFTLFGHIFEIGVFQEILDRYKQTPLFKKIIKEKLKYGGYKSGITKRNMPTEERNELTKPANEKKIHMSKVRLEETLLHILDTEETPKLTTGNIVMRSKEIFDRGLGNKTVKKYLKEIKSDLGVE